MSSKTPHPLPLLLKEKGESPHEAIRQWITLKNPSPGTRPDAIKLKL